MRRTPKDIRRNENQELIEETTRNPTDSQDKDEDSLSVGPKPRQARA
jgi:hypothetical protein